MASRYITKNGRTSRRGLFVNGVWHCDCETRLPADKFQTKNGGKNHGRWFYTCQKSQPSRCGFFLWEDEAKVREEGAVLSNSRTEPPSPQTPKKIGTPSRQAKLGSAAQIVTPSSKSRQPEKLEAIAPLATTGHGTDDWSDESVDDADLASALDEFETPRKVARTDTVTSPSKQTRKASNRSDASPVTLRPNDDAHDDTNPDIFVTPATSRKTLFTHAAPITGLATPTITPSKSSSNAPSDSSPLTHSVLTLLSQISLSPQTQSQLTDLLNKEDLRVSGITKGRDITRLAVQAKERRINELEARIRSLEQEKETMRNVIAHLKSDIATSPKRGGRKGWGKKGQGSGDAGEGGTEGGSAGGCGNASGNGKKGGWKQSIV